MVDYLFHSIPFIKCKLIEYQSLYKKSIINRLQLTIIRTLQLDHRMASADLNRTDK